MKRLLKWMTTLTLGLICLFTVPQVKAQPGYATYQDFYTELSPYGQWISDPKYGYVWIPNVGNDFRPYYTDGYWAMTDYGNTWVSNYSWGWAPFHYGRWTYDYYYGWVWIPDNVWGPAWVVWRQGGGYCGWAPMGPGMTISMSFGGGYGMPNDWWVFLAPGYLYDRGFYRHSYGPRNNITIINQTTIINNTYVDNRTRATYISGPRRQDMERITNQRIPVYQVNNATRGGITSVSNNRLNIYRPEIRKPGNNDRQAPVQVVRPDRAIGSPSAVSANNGNPAGRTRVLQQGNNNANVRPGTQQQPMQQQRIDRGQQQMQQQQQTDRAQQMQQRLQQQQTEQQQHNDRARQQQQQQMQQQQRVQQQQMQQQQMQQQQRVQQQQMEQQQRNDRARQQQMQQQQQQQRVQQQQIQQQQRMERPQPAQQRSEQPAQPRGREGR